MAVPYSFVATHVISRTLSVGLFLTVNTDTPSSFSSISNSSLGVISMPFSYQWVLGIGVPFTLTTRRIKVSSTSSSSSHIVSVCNSVSKYGAFPTSGFSDSIVSSLSSSSTDNVTFEKYTLEITVF